ncbi:MBL fold metallo-hydrolase [Sphingobium mellinum]|uniref:MBL fold metallo-hydrolase n=1 Tax=Sphingobium mellinum TaxID=1387166 RepID=UPI0030EC99AB
MQDSIAAPADAPLAAAASAIGAALACPADRPVVRGFFDEATFTATHVIHDPATRKAAIIDSVLDFDAASGRTSHHSADAIIAYVEAESLSIEWLLETHVHADHLSAASYLQERLGGRLAIGGEITSVQKVFDEIFDEEDDLHADRAYFDHLFEDGERFDIGNVKAIVLHVPGHTPADVAYVIGDALFCGDTLFMPDYGTARTDFPGGNARQLYRSIRRLLALPRETRLFLCHDYQAPGRDCYMWETTIGLQRDGNVHVHEGIDEEGFVAMRTARDATLAMPKLILPSIQVNIRGGRLPEPASNGTRYLKIPLDRM